MEKNLVDKAVQSLLSIRAKITAEDYAGQATIGSVGIEWGRINPSLAPGTTVTQNITFKNEYENIPAIMAVLSDTTSYPEAVTLTSYAVSKMAGIIKAKATTSTTYNWKITYLVIGKINWGGYCVRRFFSYAHSLIKGGALYD